MLPGSSRSGGFGLTTADLLADSPIREGLLASALARTQFDDVGGGMLFWRWAKDEQKL